MVNYKGTATGNYRNSVMNVVVKTADQQVTSSITIIDDDDLFLTLSPSKRYSGFVLMRYNSGSTPDIDYTFKAITGTTYAQFGTEAFQGTAAFGAESTQATDGTDRYSIVKFIVKTGAGGGVLQFQWAQNVSDAGATKVLEGSTLVVYQ